MYIFFIREYWNWNQKVNYTSYSKTNKKKTNNLKIPQWIPLEANFRKLVKYTLHKFVEITSTADQLSKIFEKSFVRRKSTDRGSIRGERSAPLARGPLDRKVETRRNTRRFAYRRKKKTISHFHPPPSARHRSIVQSSLRYLSNRYQTV